MIVASSQGYDQPADTATVDVTPVRKSDSAPRTGCYVAQPGGYRAFIPNPLPPSPPVEIDGEMQTLLSKADRALGRLDGSIQTLPSPDLFVLMYVRKEAVLSSQIEGTQSSLNDVLQAEAAIYDPARPKDVAEVLNYVAAMRAGLKELAQLPVSRRLICAIHERLMQGVRGEEKQPGQVRATQNWIGPPGTPLIHATFVPPPPAAAADALADLERFLNEDSTDIPLLVKIGLAHAQFETIHPFSDGNGRVGRLLITFLLRKRKILIRPVLYLSHHFLQHKSTYYELLQRTRDQGDWESWIKFFLRGVAEVANEATEVSRAIVELRETHRGQIIKNLGRGVGNGLMLLELLFQRPILQVREIAGHLDVTFAAANSLVQSIARLGIVSEATGQRRNRRFMYTAYVAIFADETERNEIRGPGRREPDDATGSDDRSRAADPAARDSIG